MRIIFLFVSFILTACSHLPPAIEDAPTYDLSYLEAVTNLTKYKNAPVRWGGTIVQVENEATFSAIQVLLYPLEGYGRPDLEETSQGRFVIKSTEFLDPAIYKKDTLITVAGTLDGDTERNIGNKTLRLPLVAVKQAYLWPEQTYSRYGGYGGFGYGYGGGFGYPYGGFYGYGPYYPGAFYGYSPYIRGWGGGGYYGGRYRR